MKNWITVTINLPPEYLENISSFLFSLGCSGIQENENSFSVFFEEAVWNNEQRTLLIEYIKQDYPDFAQDSMVISDVENQDWNEKWKENFKPLRISDHLIVLPEWENYQKKAGEETIIINPKMAFGTGHHETTKLILQLLPKYLKPGINVLDAGTGSGILAIYAARLGASAVTAFDNDPVAVENADENFELNDVKGKITSFTGEISLLKGQKFSMITANINRNVLLDLAGDMHRYIVNEGCLILSGLLAVDLELIDKSYSENGWLLVEKKQDGEWLALVFERSAVKGKNNV